MPSTPPKKNKFRFFITFTSAGPRRTGTSGFLPLDDGFRALF
jgi:hypothetical protein